MPSIGTTLSKYFLEQELRHESVDQHLLTLLGQIAYCGKILSREFSRAALVGELGLVGDKNPTGDSQKKLDLFGNETVIEAFVNTGLVAAIVSEELEEPKCIAGHDKAGYVLCIDPLDGSSNTDINGAVGMIFGVYQRRRSRGRESEGDFLRKGSEQVAAGYVMFSTSTIFVYTTGHGVFGFTLDNSLGEFLLSHKNIRCPSRGRTYSANLAHYHEWSPNVQKFIDYLVQNDPATNRPYSMRYSGALVADLHRCLIEGGIYLYPADAQHGEGKLRLLYECAPLAFVVEHAGGRATSGKERILDIQAQSIHQRVPLVIGSADDLSVYGKFLREGGG